MSLGLGFCCGDGLSGGCHGASPWYLNGIVVNKPWLKYLKRFETGKRLEVLVGGFYEGLQLSSGLSKSGLIS
ncbi:hypothetical protein [Leucothrix mucor]|uniref:hypothetical protein n=1 Tax=Leucothrix mucor TaxID=45248 RepID=UPI00058C451B|nr:hypothetical protein [Leucothrix mucor]